VFASVNQRQEDVPGRPLVGDPLQDDPLLDVAETVTGAWWLYLIAGIAWFVLAFVVLTVDAASVWTVAILAAIAFIGGGIFELVLASMVRSWKWIHVVFGVISILAGVVALAWPEQTFVVLAAVLAWYLLFMGVFEIVVAFMTRHEDELWWLRLIIGVVEVLVGFWAVAYIGRAIVLLVVWVAAAAIARGLSDLFIAFGLHGIHGQIHRTRTF
jgi:uncharacterized membrane protein HdeD (DUF308 family)